MSPPARPSVQAAVVACLLCVAACSDEPTESKGEDVIAAADTASEDTQVHADAGDEDAGPVDIGVSCPGGPYCACATNDECDTGLCIDTPAGRQCAKHCVETCLGGFVCKAVTAGSDTVNICVPRWGDTCRPCNKGADCPALGLTDAHCVDYGPLGAFCAVGCKSSGDCPVGTVCKDAQTVDGAKVKQCVRLKGPDAPDDALFGVCSCSKAAIAAQAATTCWLKDDSGPTPRRCKGVSQCASDGLTTCELLDPPVCVDAQCEGKDDGFSCDDNNPCTKADACKDNQCVPGTNGCQCQFDSDCLARGKGDLCSGTFFCDKAALPYTCEVNPATVVKCDDSADTACLANTCNPATGVCDLAPLPGAATCDDSDPCTPNDFCDAGKCTAGPDNLCECQATADCAGKEDGDKCNGVLYCDKSAAPYKCAINPASVITCKNLGSSGNSQCSKAVCAAKTGQCSVVSVDDGASCDDGHTCTKNDFCADGKCIAPVMACQCASDSHCAKFEDGDVCNGTLYCDKSDKDAGKWQCKVNPASVVVCPTVADTTWAKNTCQPVDGSCKPQPVPQGTKCEDGQKCTIGDHCDQGQCKGSKNDCLCKIDQDCAKHDDGDLCNGTMFCDLGAGGCALNPASMVTCTTVGDTECNKNQCQPKSGQCTSVSVNENGPCNDGNVCTSGDTCIGGYCAAGKVSCECQQDSDCAGKGGGDLCEGPWICDKTGGAFKCAANPFAKVNCPTVDDTDCVKSTCDKKTGKCAPLAQPEGTKCDDGDPCNEGSACATGKCSGGKSVCECQKDAECAGKDDGNPCNGTLYCEILGGKGRCAVKPGTVVSCSAANDTTCSRNTCDDKSGKCAPAAVNSGKTCDDGNLCTVGDVCGGGKCTAGQPKACGSGDPCATQACNPKTGKCDGNPLQDWCGDNSLCDHAGSCKARANIGGMKLVGGIDNFMMGNPPHKRTVYGFYIEWTEVKASDYKSCVKAGACPQPLKTGKAGKPDYAADATHNAPGKENQPINYVKQGFADKYCKWRYGSAGRLCTEPEWEFAARGTGGNKYPWGNGAPNCGLVNGMSCKKKLVDVNGYDAGRSWLGLAHMAGNVFEWTAGWYGGYPLPGGWSNGLVTSGTKKVYRGGNVFSGAGDLTTYSRNVVDPGTADGWRGFRCCRGI